MHDHRNVAQPNVELLLLPIAILIVMFVLALFLGPSPAAM
jgi:hypothetical protein